jgi:ATP-binding cassette subfamily B protein IrtA
MERQEKLNDPMIRDGRALAILSFIVKGALLMDKQRNGELSSMFEYAGNYHALTVLGCILSGISTILSMLPFVCIWLVVRDLLGAFTAGDISLATESAHYAWMAAGFSAASIFVYFIALNCTHLAAFRTATNMRKKAIHHIVTLPLGYFSQNASGRLRKIIDDNAGLTEGFLAHQLPDLTGAIVMPVAVMILIFLFDWRLGICCLIPMGISVLFLKRMMGGDNAQFMGKYMMALETMNKEAVEYIRGIPVVKVFQQTVYSFKNFHAAIEEYEKFASGYALKCRIPLTGFTVTLNSTYVLLIPAAMFILSGVSGRMTYENVVLDFLFYSLFTPVCATMMNRIMFASEQLMAAKSAVSRLDEILQEKPLKKPEHPMIPADASIVFSDVSFSYPGAKEKALDHISFEVPAGKTVALVGASGSGKSTAASLIPRFYDVQSGSVSIGGVDVRDIEKQELMKRVAFVFQNTCLFKDTLLNNIKAARPDASREEVLRAVDDAQCRDIIDRLPNGLDTLVGTGGTYLSGGENQRIALARAILKDAPIIVLDEATAFADAENEHQIQLAFERLTKNKTVLMIAHRLSTIQDADLILVFKDGQIAERGNHEELLASDGIYSSMWQAYQKQIAWKIRKEDVQHD